MRLDPKYFNVFMLGIAIISALAIFYATISYQGDQLSSFKSYVSESDSLVTSYMRVIASDDSIRISDFAGRPIALQFWSSWSQKSLHMQYEMKNRDGLDSLLIIAASVKDVLTDVERHMEEHNDSNIVFVDGTKIYNELKAPGIPSYILFNASGEPVNANVGYKEGSIQDSLKYYLNNE